MRALRRSSWRTRHLVRIALALLEREYWTPRELKLIMEGKPLAAKVVPPKGDDGVQQVLNRNPDSLREPAGQAITA